MKPSPDIPAESAPLAARMGEAHFARRREIEVEREREYHDPLGANLTFIKHRIITPVLRAGCKACGLYSRGYRNFLRFRAETLEVALRGLPEGFAGFRLLHISDLHADLDPRFAPAAARFLSGIDCDACVITGDFRNLTVGPWQDAVDGSASIVEAIRAPVYAVLGNHDTIDMVPALERAGARFLLNECAVLERGGAALALAGIDDPNIYGTDDLERAKSGAPRNAFMVLASHSPCIYRRAEAEGFGLLLAGHTHGGQVCLPGGHPIINNDPTPRRYQRGLWKYRGLVGHTSTGIGSCATPIRLNCPPKATVLTLVCA